MRSAAPVHPLWMRWVAALCLLMAGVVGTAQAAHIHGQLLPNQKLELHQPAADAGALGGEEHCPLCVAMHSTALPEAEQQVFAPATRYVAAVPEQAVSRPETLWHYARFGRPPPAI